MTATPARAAAFAVLRDVRGGELADRAFARRAASVPLEARPFLRELVYGTLRLRGRLDHIIAHFAGRPVDRIDPGALDALRLGIHQLRWMGGVPDYAAVSESVDLAGRRAAGFVNAVLRAAARAPDEPGFPTFEADPVAHLTTWGSHPHWLIERWVRNFGAADARALVEANNRVPEVFLRPAGITMETAQERLRAVDIDVEIVASNALRLVRSADLISALDAIPAVVQDPAAGFVVDFVGPVDGKFVYDGCAAPGGKAVALAAGTGAERAAYVFAADVSAGRMTRVAENARRVRAQLGALPLGLGVADARRPPVTRADVVIVDVPCTGTGTLRRHPDGRWRIGPKDLAALVALQQEIMEGAASAVASGGLLVYATCSLEPEENEAQVDTFLRKHTEFTVEPGTGPADARGFLRVLPHEHGFDGAFAARLRRRVDAG